MEYPNKPIAKFENTFLGSRISSIVGGLDSNWLQISSIIDVPQGRRLKHRVTVRFPIFLQIDWLSTQSADGKNMLLPSTRLFKEVSIIRWVVGVGRWWVVSSRLCSWVKSWSSIWGCGNWNFRCETEDRFGVVSIRILDRFGVVSIGPNKLINGQRFILDMLPLTTFNKRCKR